MAARHALNIPLPPPLNPLEAPIKCLQKQLFNPLRQFNSAKPYFPMRRHLDHFLELNISPQERYRLRNKAEGLCPRCGRRPAWGSLECPRHQSRSRKSSRRWQGGHPERAAQRNLERQQRYAYFRGHNYSPAESRVYSGSPKWLISPPFPCSLPAKTKIITKWPKFREPKPSWKAIYEQKRAWQR